MLGAFGAQVATRAHHLSRWNGGTADARGATEDDQRTYVGDAGGVAAVEARLWEVRESGLE